MAYILVDRASRLLLKLDRQYGIQATYRVATGTVFDPTVGDMVRNYVDTPVVIRPHGFSSIELSQLSTSGLGQIDARWWMRRAYMEEVRPGHILGSGSFFYEVIDGGATLDDLQLLWTILTRRRR